MNNLESVSHTLVIEDPTFTRTINLDGATYSIGRHSSNDIVLSCQKTSRHHATLLRRTDVKTNDYSYWILDGDLQGNRSRNGIYINGKKCLVHELKHGDAIKFSGDARAKYQVVSGLSQEAKPPVVSDNIVNHQTAFNKETLAISESPIRHGDYAHQELPSNSFAELSPQPIVEIDLYGKITYMNSAALLNFQEIQQQQLNHPVLENLISLCHSQNGKLFTREVEVNGRYFRQDTFYLPSNKILRSYLFDITNEKTLAQQLKAKETLQESIFKELREGVIVVNGTTKKIIEANKNCSDLLGYSLKEIRDMNIYNLSFETETLATTVQRVIDERASYQGQSLL